MKATIISFNRSINHYEATTDNDIALSFSVLDAEHLKLNEVLEVDLTRIVTIQQLESQMERLSELRLENMTCMT